MTCLAAGLGVGEIIVIVACAAIVLGVVCCAIVRKRKGKRSCGGCDGCCGSCPHCSDGDRDK